MKRVQHIQIMLNVRLTLQLPTSEELAGNRHPYTEEGITAAEVARFTKYVSEWGNPDCHGIGAVDARVQS